MQVGLTVLAAVADLKYVHLLIYLNVIEFI